jgi:hypothetical protein
VRYPTIPVGQQRGEADHRAVDPPIRVETATWSKPSQLDRWVKERFGIAEIHI